MTETSRPPARRTFLGCLGGAMGLVGAGFAGFALLRSAAPSGYDPRIRVDLPETPDGYFKRITCQGRPVGILGLDRVQTARWTPAPGAPPFVVLNLVCTHDHCVVGRRDDATTDGWVCPCCGSGYELDGARLYGPAKRGLAAPPFQFVGRRALLIGPAFQAT